MSPTTIVEEALAEGRALFSAAGGLRDLFKAGRAEVESLTSEAKGAVDAVLSELRAGLDDFKAQASAIAAGPAPAGAAAAPAPDAAEGTSHGGAAPAVGSPPAADEPQATPTPSGFGG